METSPRRNWGYCVSLAPRACLKIRKGAVFGPQAGWRGATKENIPGGSSTEEQRSQRACGAKTLRAAGLLPVGFVGSVLTAVGIRGLRRLRHSQNPSPQHPY